MKMFDAGKTRMIGLPYGEKQGRQSIVKIGGPKRRGGLGDGSPPAGSRGRAPGGGLGPLGRSPQKLKHITELNLNSECNCIDVY